MMRLPFLAGLLALAACGDFPHDTGGTLEKAKGGELRVGWVAASRQDAGLRAFVSDLAGRIGTRATSEDGAAEDLLMRLEHGELDLVVGHFDRKTPWATRVTFSKPIATRDRPHGKVDSIAVVRNGEHAFAMAVDRVILDAQAGGQ